MKEKIFFYNILFIIMILLFFTNCRTMMVNQTAETLKPGKMETTGLFGIGADWGGSNIPSLKMQYGLQQRFGLIENIEIQFLLFTDLNVLSGSYAFQHISNYIRLNPKFRLYHNDVFDFSLFPVIGVFNVIGRGGYSIDYFGPFIGMNLILSHKFGLYKNISIYYGFGIELGENFLTGYYNTHNDPPNYFQNRFLTDNMLLDISLCIPFGLEVKKNNFITRHEIDITTSFDIERNIEPYMITDNYISDYISANLDIYLSINYGFSIGGQYSNKKNIQDEN